MGMAASQARFLGLTARKTNTEFEGQQINQQRTTLSNQSANYYNQLLGMTVPTPPSIQDFTKTTYSFSDGALDNTINSLIAQADGTYLVSYTRKWTDDFAAISAGSSIVTRAKVEGTDEYTYSVGATPLRKLGDDTGYENDPYLSSLSDTQRQKAILEEQEYLAKLNEQYGEADWMDMLRILPLVLGSHTFIKKRIWKKKVLCILPLELLCLSFLATPLDRPKSLMRLRALMPS